MAIKNTYLVEGQTEEKLIKYLSSERKIPPGKTKVFSLWDKKVKNILRTFSRKDNCVYVVFDTDVLSNITNFNANIQCLSCDRSIKSIILIQQSLNLEDEIARCCNLTKANLYANFSAAGANDFKSRFIKVQNLGVKLDMLGFDNQCLWVQGLNRVIQATSGNVVTWQW